MEKTDEQNLALLAQRGDAEAFGAIYDLYVKRIYAFIYFKVHHRETAQDLTSDTFLKALGGLGGFDAGRGSMGPWLYRIARNTVIDHYRRRRPETALDEDAWDVSADGTLDADIDALMRLADVRAEMKKLKPAQRDIVVMRVWQQMSYAEIAAALDLNEAACRMAFSRAVKQLRQGLPLAVFITLIIPTLWTN